MKFSLHFPGAAVLATDAVKATTIQGDISPDPSIYIIMSDLIMDGNVDYYDLRIRALERRLKGHRGAGKKAAGR
jgi:hypothetical protein